MTKKNFVFLVMLVLGGVLFSLGMCMCLVQEWNAFQLGVVMTTLGAAVLLVIALVRWIMAGRPMVKVNWKKVGKAAYCVAALLVLGAGMAMIMAFEGLMFPGVAVGVIGLLLALGMIPVCKGLK